MDSAIANDLDRPGRSTNCRDILWPRLTGKFMPIGSCYMTESVQESIPVTGVKGRSCGEQIVLRTWWSTTLIGTYRTTTPTTWSRRARGATLHDKNDPRIAVGSATNTPPKTPTGVQTAKDECVASAPVSETRIEGGEREVTSS